MSDISVFLVDDHELFLSGVRAELAQHFTIAGSASTVDDAIDGIRKARLDVVLVDVHMPGGGGEAVIVNIREGTPDMKFLALSVSDAPEDVIAMIRSGARGYVTKSIAPADLIDSVARIAGGDAVFSPKLAGFVLDAFAGAIPTPNDPELDQLTPPRARGTSPDCDGPPLQTGGQTNVDLCQDCRDARLRRPTKAPALKSARIGPLGFGPTHRVSRAAEPLARRSWIQDLSRALSGSGRSAAGSWDNPSREERSRHGERVSSSRHRRRAGRSRDRFLARCSR